LSRAAWRLFSRAPRSDGTLKIQRPKTIMARKKQRKKSWPRTVLLFVLIPLFVWFLAFLLWFYWYDVSQIFTRNEARPDRSKPDRQTNMNERREGVPAKRPAEQILDDERKGLEDILKRRN
jgi:hypothetical protein